MWLLGLHVACFPSPGYGEITDFSDQQEMFRRLVGPTRLIADGKPFREALASVAAEAEVNLCLDRRIDPTEPVALGPLGPTRYLALDQLARSRDCVMMPIANVLLIGRPEWVDQTTVSVIESISGVRSNNETDVRWGDLTTPRQAVEAVGGWELDVTAKLPHDLWPATSWREIEPSVAVTLVLAQVQLRPLFSDKRRLVSIADMPAESAISGKPVTRRYSFSAANPEFVKTFLSVDRSAKAPQQSGWVTASGQIEAHRRAIATVMASIRSESSDIDTATFTIKRMRTSATKAFNQFAKMAGRSCQIQQDAVAACAQVVSLEGVDLTLRQLTERVAREVGVTAEWSDDAIMISLANE